MHWTEFAAHRWGECKQHRHRGRTINERIIFRWCDSNLQRDFYFSSFFCHLIIFIIFECFSLSEHSREYRLDMYCNKLFHAILNFVLISVWGGFESKGGRRTSIEEKHCKKLSWFFILWVLKCQSLDAGRKAQSTADIWLTYLVFSSHLKTYFFFSSNEHASPVESRSSVSASDYIGGIIFWPGMN